MKTTKKIWLKRAGAALLLVLLPMFVLGDLARNLWRMNRQALRWTAGSARAKVRQLAELHRELWTAPAEEAKP